MSGEKKKLKICIITGTYPNMICGVGFHSYFLGNALAEQGITVSIITSKSISIPEDVLNSESPKVYTIIKDWSFLTFFSIKYIIKEIKPDVVHVQLPTRGSQIYSALLFSLLNLIYYKKPLILTLHEFSEGLFWSKIRGIFLIAIAPYIIFPNLNDLRFALRIFTFKRKNLFHVPLGPTLPIEKLLKNENQKKNEKDIAYLGILYPRKGIEVLIEAIAKINQHFPEIQVHMLSSFIEENPYHRSLEELAKQLGVDKNIVWYRNIKLEEIAKRIIRCNIACLPYPEGATYKRSTLLEVLTSGVAVITTQTKKTRKDLIHGKNVYLVPPNNPIAISEAIVELYKNEMLLNTISKEGQKLAMNFTWSRIAEMTKKIYEEVAH